MPCSFYQPCRLLTLRPPALLRVGSISFPIPGFSSFPSFAVSFVANSCGHAVLRSNGHPARQATLKILINWMNIGFQTNHDHEVGHLLAIIPNIQNKI
jgi:hypothetical protein